MRTAGQSDLPSNRRIHRAIARVAGCCGTFRGAKKRALRQRPFRAAIEVLEPRVLLAFDPSQLQQAMIEDINRIRTSPRDELGILFSETQPLTSSDADIQAAIDFFDIDSATLLDQWDDLQSVAPVAWNQSLVDAAVAHSQLMIERGEQSHQMAGEPNLPDRVVNAGYNNWSVLSENIYAFAESTIHAHAGFVIDWGDTPTGIQDPPGHRQNILDPRVREVGLAVLNDTDPKTDVGPLVVTQDFGSRRDYSPQLLGVVFDDNDGDGRYDAGEGIGGIHIQIVGGAGALSTTSMSAGGFQLPVSNGTYTVTVTGGALKQSVSRSGVIMSGANVKVDFDLDGFVSPPGDSNRDGRFNQLDIVTVLQAAKYMTGQPATFEQGDWNGDGTFGALDIVLALQSGRYGQAAGAMYVGRLG